MERSAHGRLAEDIAAGIYDPELDEIGGSPLVGSGFENEPAGDSDGGHA